MSNSDQTAPTPSGPTIRPMAPDEAQAADEWDFKTARMPSLDDVVELHAGVHVERVRVVGRGRGTMLRVSAGRPGRVLAVLHRDDARAMEDYYWLWPTQEAKTVEEVAERRMGLVRAPTPHELANRFTYHAPKADQPQIYEAVREKARDLATIMAAYCPPSDELARALDHLDNAVFCANAAVARHG